MTWGDNLRERMDESVNKRGEMLERFGFIPSSVLRITRGLLHRRMRIFQQEDPKASISSKHSLAKNLGSAEKADEIEQVYKDVGWKGPIASFGNPQSKRASASVMAAEVVDFFLKYYAEPGDVYLDPFMGQGVQMQVAHLRGFEYWGYDLSEVFFPYIERVRELLIAKSPEPELHIFQDDSRCPCWIPDGIGGFSFHSPPYWDIEDYGEHPDQLGTGKTYEEFLDGMETVARAWLPKFRPGAFHVVNVNDFRKSGIFYSYHSDTIALFRRAGWVLHDTWICEGTLGRLPMLFGVKKNLERIAPKVHEYFLVFRSPDV